MFKKTLVGLIVLFLGIGFDVLLTTPKEVRISRSILIETSPGIIFPYVNSPRMMQQWNPFTDGDPTLKMTYSGPQEGVGAASAWEGNSQTGQGQATIVEVDPNKRVAVRLDLIKPFEGTNFGEYLIEPKGSGTLFTWTIIETATIPRMISCFADLDHIVGGQFEKGLVKLKSITEAEGSQAKPIQVDTK